METKQKTTLTQGSVARGMLLFALPIFISNLFQQLYNAADSLIVGNFLGGEALAAVGSSGSLIFLLTGFVNGVSLGAGVVVARYFGAKDWDRMRRTIHTTVALGLVAGVGLTVIGVILTPQILRWMGTDPEVLPDAISYFRYYFTGVLAVVLYNACKSIMNALGDSKRPLYYLIISSLTNIVLDLLFVIRFGWGIPGAAAAARQARDLDPEDGVPYFILAQCYASSAGSCGGFAGLATYWAAYDTMAKAVELLPADSEYMEHAKSSLGKFRSVFPSSEECFFNELQEGARYTVTCGTAAGITTTVRAR